MKTNNTKHLVIDALLHNLTRLIPGTQWNKYHPLIAEYIANMDSPKRIYRTWDLVARMLVNVRDLESNQVQEIDLLDAAILFMYSIFDPGHSDNFDQSIYFAGKFYPVGKVAAIDTLISVARFNFPFEKSIDDRDLLRDIVLDPLTLSQDELGTAMDQLALEYKSACSLERFRHITHFYLNALKRQSKSGKIFQTESFTSKESNALGNIEFLLNR